MLEMQRSFNLSLELVIQAFFQDLFDLNCGKENAFLFSFSFSRKKKKPNKGHYLNELLCFWILLLHTGLVPFFCRNKFTGLFQVSESFFLQNF